MTPAAWLIHAGDALATLQKMPDESVHCVITSPPYYGLRDYGVDGQIGLEKTPMLYLDRLVGIFREVRRVLRNDGTCWVNMGDNYCSGTGKDRLPTTTSGLRVPASWSNRSQPQRIGTSAGIKPKDLMGTPWALAFALRADGWYLRQDIIWSKPNPMPESVRDRCTKAHEYIFLLTKGARYFYDADAVREPFIADHPAGNQSHEGLTAFEAGDDRHRTKAGLVAYAASHRGSTFTQGKSKNAKLKPESVGEGSLQDHGGRNKRSVWTFATMPTPEAHFATFPLDLPETCLKAGCPEGGTVLDPFAGAGTTGLAALKNGRNFVGIELNPEYIEIANSRARKHYPLLVGAA